MVLAYILEQLGRLVEFVSVVALDFDGELLVDVRVPLKVLNILIDEGVLGDWLLLAELFGLALLLAWTAIQCIIYDVDTQVCEYG